MNDSFDLVCCSLEDWDDVWRRNQFLVRELLELEPRCRVLFVEPPNDLLYGIRQGRLGRPRPLVRPVKDMPNVWALKPYKVLPRVLGGGADRQLARQVEHVVADLGFERPLLWINDTAYATLAARVRWPVLYDVTDDWLLAEAAPRELRRRQRREAFLLARANEVVVCSPGLAAARGRERPVRIITNAVDAARYRVPTERPPDLPRDPVAVYVGTLHRDRLDVGLVLRAADAAPGIQFAFVGPVALGGDDVATLRARPNVSLLGPRPSASVPAYLQHASVLVVPHVVNAFTNSLDPIKAYEYLAAGRPVVTTPVAGFRDLRIGHVTCADGARFADSVIEAASRNGRFPVPALPSWREQAAAFRDALVDARDQTAGRHLRVVYLDHSSQLSGAELALARLLPALTGVDPVVLLAEPGPLQARLAHEGIRAEIVVLGERTQSLRRDRLHAGRLPVSALWDAARYVMTLRGRIRELQPDLVHTNSLKAAVYGSIAGRLAGVPVVCHVRDRIASDYLPRPAVFGVRRVLRYLPSGLIANSTATLDTVGLPRRLARRPTNAVVHDVVHPAATRSSPRRSGPFRVGMIGRLAPWKGQHIFLDAFAAAFAGSDTRAVIVGSAMFGEDDYAEDLGRRAAALGIAERVEFSGFVEDVYGAMSSMDALVHASVTAEPFGQVVVEAMAAGVPVVATAAGGPLEVIEAGVNGLLVPPGDVAALADALRTLHGDPALRSRLAMAARADSTRFHPEVIAEQVQCVYESVLRPKGGGEHH